MEEGSPQAILSRGEPVQTPPMLIMQGTADDNLTPDMASRFADAYAEAGGDIDLHMFRGCRTPSSRPTRRRLTRCGRWG